MGKITLLSSHVEEARRLVEEGKDIVHFLTCPFTPCFVYHHAEQVQAKIAINYGNFDGMHKFRSIFGELSGMPDQVLYMVEFLADEKVVVKSNDINLGFYDHSLKVRGQRGFCRLLYDGLPEEILAEFMEQGYEVFEFFPDTAEPGTKSEMLRRWQELERQKEINLKKRQEDIADFYYRRG
jgi:hypothetical protein